MVEPVKTVDESIGDVGKMRFFHDYASLRTATFFLKIRAPSKSINLLHRTSLLHKYFSQRCQLSERLSRSIFVTH